jgi:hypothetical protein
MDRSLLVFPFIDVGDAKVKSDIYGQFTMQLIIVTILLSLPCGWR